MASVFYKIKQTGVFPVCWKSSIVSPTFNKGSKANVENYRKISLLCIISKIFERTFFDSLYRYASPYFSDSQFGFRKQRSCITQLLIYLDKIYNSLDSDDEIHVIYTDYEQAFDNVDLGILLQKLYKIGIRGRVFKLMPSYLANRTQRVRINGRNSGYQWGPTMLNPRQPSLSSLYKRFASQLQKLPTPAMCRRCELHLNQQLLIARSAGLIKN